MIELDEQEYVIVNIPSKIYGSRIFSPKETIPMRKKYGEIAVNRFFSHLGRVYGIKRFFCDPE